MNITIELDDKATQAELQAMQKRLANPGPVLRDVGENMLQQAKARFGTGIGADGLKWKPKKQQNGRPTLVGETGDLRRQMAWKVSGSLLTVQATAPYAAIHQFGGTIERAPYSTKVRHRTDAKGNLLRTKAFNGKGLVFAKDSAKRARERWFEVKAYSIKIPARPFLPIQASGQLYPDERDTIVRQIQGWVRGESEQA